MEEESVESNTSSKGRRAHQFQYFEQEIAHLREVNSDLLESLRINKKLVSQLADPSKNRNKVMEYTITSLNHENELLEGRNTRLEKERQTLHDKLLILQQIVDGGKSHEEHLQDEFYNEIEELKENLERKEYML